MSVMIRRLEAIEVSQKKQQQPAQVNQLVAPSYFNCQNQTHVLEDCPLLPNQAANIQEQINAAFQWARNDPYSQTYNLGWKNHPNFSWN